MTELLELVARHLERLASAKQLGVVLVKPKRAREGKGLSLRDLTDLTGMDPSAPSSLEKGQRPNPTIETLARYAEAGGG